LFLIKQSSSTIKAPPMFIHKHADTLNLDIATFTPNA